MHIYNYIYIYEEVKNLKDISLLANRLIIDLVIKVY